MKVLSISADRKIFEDGSAVRRRMIECGKSCDEMHIIVFSTQKHSTPNNQSQISENVFVYPTDSRSRWSYVFDAVRLGKGLPKPDLVTAQDPFECGLAGWRLSRFFGAKLELQIHTDLGSPYFRRSSLLNTLRIVLARFLLPRADHIRVVSVRIKNYLVSRLKIPGPKIEVRPIFVDTEKIKNIPIKTDLHKKYTQFEKIILMASRLTREKNIPLALSAMASVIRKYPKALLLIVGDGPEGERLKERSRKLGLEKNVILESWTDDLPSYYKTADLFLATSLYEGYGMALVEAQAADCPIISTDVGVAREIGATLVENSAHALSEAILEKLKN